MTEMGCCNANLNNKRLSKLQRLILKVLNEWSLRQDYTARTIIAWDVARRYGNGSIVNSDQRIKTICLRVAENYESNKQLSPNLADLCRALESMEAKASVSQFHKCEWLAPKFSVSWTRSLNNLIEQGLVYSDIRGREYPYIALRITASGRKLLADKP